MYKNITYYLCKFVIFQSCLLDDGADFNSTNTNIIFANGTSTVNGTIGCISINILDDEIFEGSQFFTVEIMSIYPQIATGTGLSVSVEILDNEGKCLISYES